MATAAETHHRPLDGGPLGHEAVHDNGSRLADPVRTVHRLVISLESPVVNKHNKGGALLGADDVWR